MDHWPEVYLSMGLTAERMQRKYGVSREDADAFALLSHQNALRAQAGGHFVDEIVPVEVEYVAPGKVEHHVFDRDEGPRADTSLEALAKLQAGLPCQRYGDGGQLVADQRWRGRGARDVGGQGARNSACKPKARFVSFATAGVPPEIMGIGPVVAIPKALAMAGLKLDDIGVIELNEAFAVQALARDPRGRPRPGARQRERRRDRAGPSAGLHRREVDGHDPARNGAPATNATAWSPCASAADRARPGSLNCCNRRPSRGPYDR